LRSHPETSRAALVLAALLTVVAPTARATDLAPAPLADVQRVVKEMNADPALNGQHVEHQLRWKHRNERKPDANDAAPWMMRIARWIAGAGRGLMWVLGAIAVALIAVYAWRWASVRSDAQRARAELLPSHVNELDIRPESLPSDIAGAAATLSRRGEQRAALSLLYRGALSRLVHDHRVPIRAASTEGECVQLVARALPREASAYFRRLVDAWQTEVYAGRSAEPMDVIMLCNEFDAHFAPRLGPAPQASMATA